MAPTGSSARRKSARKTKRTMSSGQVHILATFNNTIVTVTDHQGNARIGLRRRRRRQHEAKGEAEHGDDVSG